MKIIVELKPGDNYYSVWQEELHPILRPMTKRTVAKKCSSPEETFRTVAKLLADMPLPD